jgi:hypothetical protein
VRVSVPHDGRRPALEPGVDREHAAQAVHSSAKPAEHHPEQGKRGPALETDRNEPEHQTAPAALPREHPGEAAELHGERSPGRFLAAEGRSEHSRSDSERPGEAPGEATARPFEPEPDREAGE